MPTATDLVTDLPADFEVFGQAVATSMADLLGGTTGQILSKASNTNMDFTWITNDVGDITAITVTSPITGGGTSGSVGIAIQDASTTQRGSVQLSDSTSTTSSVLASTPTATKAAYDLAVAAVPKSTVTTNGDLIYGTGSSTVSRIGIGSTGQILTVAAGIPAWSTPAAAGYVGVGLTKSADQSLTNATYTAISWDGEGWDTNSFHDNATNNSRVTIPSGKAGKYLVEITFNFAASGVGSIRLVNLYKNGVGTGDVNFSPNPTFNAGAVFSKVLDLAVSDYIQAFAYQDSGGALNLKATSFGTSMQVTYLGA
jgi:hypothetical protein